MTKSDIAPPPHATAALILADGTIFFGEAIGSQSSGVGEICFNTAMTGYQEILTDPSYAGQIITFTFPHIGNIGANTEDVEASLPYCAGLVVREKPTLPSNFRSHISLDAWLKQNKIPGICGVDTRALTRHIRTKGAQNAVIVSLKEATWREHAKALLDAAPDMAGLDLAKDVTTDKIYEWHDTLWQLAPRNKAANAKSYHVVAIDFGVKHNILRSLAERGMHITVMPATSKAADVLKHNPDGIFLSNGPGDPAATGEYALPMIKELVASGKPIFGICLGHQLLGIALGGKTEKMTQGHRGANHPVKDLKGGQVIITSQNHGFAVSKEGLPDDVEITHISLFDGTVQGLRHKTKPIFCMQGHPEASPGPHDSQYLFDKFAELMENVKS
ncbi:MAG: glutamine-hydrolyzing carbamoyl-phosphate synthase small subunit [Rickettsiales bacterium]|nr:glutamine-hydrolyzing carbamoyl-phosphate synthase small subunit [Rickettsiales bacterium]